MAAYLWGYNYHYFITGSDVWKQHAMLNDPRDLRLISSADNKI